jgi:2-polyprenyl-3-methyl-5-hydroxy-6-metoxy-1,4-benzoquinol methylase
MSLRDATPDETKESWKGYYSELAAQQGSEGFQKVFDEFTYVHTWYNSIRMIEKCTKMHDGARVLDAGCGWGRTLLGVLERHTGLDVTAVDLQEDALEIGRNLIGDESQGNTISWQQGDLNGLDLPDEEFDVIYSARVFQHLDNHGAGVEELLRMLKPGGRFLIFLQNRLCPLNKDYYARMYGPDEVRSWFEGATPSKLTVSTMDFYPGKMSSALPLPIRMGIEAAIGHVPFVNRYGGKVAAWGVK